MTKPDPETYTEAETEAGREAALKRMLNTSHKPQKTPAGSKPRRGRSSKQSGN